MIREMIPESLGRYNIWIICTHDFYIVHFCRRLSDWNTHVNCEFIAADWNKEIHMQLRSFLALEVYNGVFVIILLSA